MKKVILCVALILSVLPVGYANARTSACTTDDNAESSECYDCSLFLFSNNVLSCATDLWRTRMSIDNCVGNYEGEMVHGQGAGDSCKDYQLQDDVLHAQCRTGAGDYIATSIDIREYFEGFSVAAAGVGGEVIRCAQ